MIYIQEVMRILSDPIYLYLHTYLNLNERSICESIYLLWFSGSSKQAPDLIGHIAPY